ncbi:sporulation protein YlmC with PRC-barrel domain [Algoriphagus sp. 4150]|uniref:PRC-barrel domain-containing protein n=1 Tax=Algoriphagus sp. 4150 TaxID=2817756 RepID=UPI002857EBC5|nr:PRC-barrel domain-containing protein [Algoriphagus sp. 4150]MDR7131380.1 sporulation protein YlmC with PRC-barrel domain [Algoriphagus sp. 4150]
MNTQYNFPISSSTATDCAVKTIKDEVVGTIKDIMLDTETGEVAYVVLSVDTGFLNLGSKLLALPWEAFDFHGHQRDVIIVKAAKEKLENAPGFDNDAWPVGPQYEFINEVHTYYGFDRRRALIE